MDPIFYLDGNIGTPYGLDRGLCMNRDSIRAGGFNREDVAFIRSGIGNEIIPFLF